MATPPSRPARPTLSTSTGAALRALGARGVDPFRYQKVGPHRAHWPSHHGQPPGRGAGWEFLHIAIDDHSKLAFAQLRPSESAPCAIAFLHDALAFFSAHGVHAQRLYSDNGPAYRSHLMRATATALGLQQRFTRPYTPKTNGKAERFIQTSLREWAYAHSYSHSDQRSARLPAFLHNYNWHRPHHALKLLPPASRLHLSLNNLLSLHT